MRLSAFTVARRAIRHRPGRSALVVSIAALAVAAAVATAGYQRAGHASLLADAVSGAPSYATRLSLVATGARPPSMAEGVAALRAAGLPGRWFGEPVGSVSTEVTVPMSPGGPVAATLAYRDGFCAHVVLVGVCASAPGEVMVSSRTTGLAVGDRVAGGVVVGVYTPRDPGEPYWGAVPYFAAGPDPAGVRIDALFVGVPADVRGAVLSVRVDAELAGVRLDDLSGLRGALGRLAADPRGFAVNSGLGAVVADAGDGTFDLTLALVGVPLVLLCLGVLGAVVGALAGQRAPEIALASLRGFPPERAVRHGSAETLLLVALATPIGLAGGLAAVEVAAKVALARGVGVEVRWPVLVAALGAGGVAALACYAVTVRWGRRPALELMRRVRRGSGRSGWLVGGGVVGVTATVTGVVLDRGSPVGWFATPAVALLVGVGAARGLVGFGRWMLRRATTVGRGDEWVVRMLVGARLARGGRPVPAALGAVAVALLVFGALGWDSGAVARGARADDVVGADRVLAVRVAYPTALIAAVDAADPGGHSMAVARTTQRFAGTDVDVIGVDSPRLAAVARWRGMAAPQLVALAAALTPEAAPALVTGGRMSVTVNVRSATPGGVELGALLAVPGGAPVAVPLGTLAVGTATLTHGGALAECRSGCRLAGLTLAPTRPGDGRVRADVRVTGLRVGDLDAALDRPDAWRAADGLAVTAGRSLRVLFDSSDLGPRVARYVDAPAELPVVVAGPPPAPGPAFSFPGLRDNAQAFAAVAHPSRVPRAGRRALLFDLTYAVRAAEAAGASGDDLRYEVWASPGAPPDLARRLAAQGVTVLATQTRAGYLAALDRSAPALGLGFYLGAGTVALLFAAMLGALEPLLGASQRAAELVALGFAGVRRRALGRAVTVESVATASVIWLVGAVTGVVGAVVLAGSGAGLGGGSVGGAGSAGGFGAVGAFAATGSVGGFATGSVGGFAGGSDGGFGVAGPIAVTWSGAVVVAVIGSLFALATVVAAARRPLRALPAGGLGRLSHLAGPARTGSALGNVPPGAAFAGAAAREIRAGDPLATVPSEDFRDATAVDDPPAGESTGADGEPSHPRPGEVDVAPERAG